MPVNEVKVDVEERPATAVRGSGRIAEPDQMSPALLDQFLADATEAERRELEKAKYKIEVIFSRHRSPSRMVPSPSMVLIWESGKKFHGGGDQRMYWCGHDDCSKPLSSDNFGYMHVICPKCHREMFLDPRARDAHARDMMERGLDPKDLRKVPYVTGEILQKVIPDKLASFLEKTWRQLDGDADIYIKYSPYDIRYQQSDSQLDIAHKLNMARSFRQPVIYSLKNIIKDIHAGASLQKRFLALLTS